MRLFLLGGFVFALFNLYFRKNTLKSLNNEIKSVTWINVPKEEYIRKCYDFVAERFTKMKRCYVKRPWRNFYFTNLWKYKKSLPCHLQNNLFRRCLLKRFDKKEVKTVVSRYIQKGVLIHFHSKVKLNGKWIDVDVWGKKRGIPFGKNVHNSQID